MNASLKFTTLKNTRGKHIISSNFNLMFDASRLQKEKRPKNKTIIQLQCLLKNVFVFQCVIQASHLITL